MSRRTIRLSNGETAEQRAVRIAETQLAGWIAERAARGDETDGPMAYAHLAGFIAGYLAAADDWCEEPAKPARRGR